MAKKTNTPSARQILDRLNQIIDTQSVLAAANFDVNKYMNLVVEQVKKLTPATGAVVELVEKDEMVYKAATGTVKSHIGLRLSRENSISGLCVKTKKILRSDDTEEDPRVNKEACRLVQARSLIVTPLFYEGKAVGVLKVLSKKPKGFNEYDVQTLQLMAGLIGSALAHQISHETVRGLLRERTKTLKELKKAKEKLQYMAHHDFLTGLPNRSLFMDRLNLAINRSKRKNKLLVLFFLDIDHFKNINDTYGHDIGDSLLRSFSSRISSCVRAIDTLARLGGDEFVVLLDEVPDKTLAISIAKKIIDKMQTSFVLQDQHLKVGTSIGIAFYADDHNKYEFIQCADQALYMAKQAGRNNFKIYKPT